MLKCTSTMVEMMLEKITTAGESSSNSSEHIAVDL